MQYELYQLRERALKEGNRETAEQCKHLLHEAERLFKERAQSWIAEAELLLEQQDVEPQSTTSNEK